ncbi:MAG: hypothetical protein HQ592_06300 [Planctomycetes bacterium]|nr:hypothetical protein [Planctomycetota bacterium]
MPDLPRQVRPRQARRRYFIDRKLQLGLAAALTAFAAASAIALAAYSYRAARHNIESIRMRAHVPYSNTRQLARPAVMWGVSGAFALMAAVVAGSLVVTSRRAKGISRHYAPLFQKMARGEFAEPTGQAAAAGGELASAYVELTRAHDKAMAKARVHVEYMRDLLEQTPARPDAAPAVSRASRRIIEEISAVHRQSAGNATTQSDQQEAKGEADD